MNKPDCLEPVLILNPAIRRFICRATSYYVDGQYYSMLPEYRYRIMNNEYPGSVLRLRPAHSLIRDSKKYSDKEWKDVQRRLDSYLDGCFLLDSKTLERCPLYIYVPCGHCDCCQSKKLASYAQRCEFALQESQRPAYFVTLTYNNKHYPDDVTSKRDLQLFKKKLKRNIGLHLIYSMHYSIEKSNDQIKKIKFVCTSEFGSRNGRLHYHMIVFGVPELGLVTPLYDESEYYFRKLCQFCWRETEREGIHVVTFKDYCFYHPESINVKDGSDPYSKGYVNVSPCHSSKHAVKYCLKYAFKNTQDKTFKSISVNLGLLFAMKFRKHFLNSNSNEFEYYDFMSGQTVKTSFTSYYLKKLFPSESSLLKSKFVDGYFNAYLDAKSLIQTSFIPTEYKDIASSVLCYLRNTYPFMNVLNVLVTDKSFKSYSEDDCLQIVDDMLQNINIMSNYEFDYEDILKQVNDRAKVLSVFEKTVPRTRGQLIDVSNRFIRSVKDYQSRAFL